MSLLFFAFLHLPVAFAATSTEASTAYVDVLTTEAARNLERVAGRDPARLKNDAEKGEWAKARLAWISFARLQGREEEALKIFAGCAEICGKFGEAGEWAATKAWACGKRPALAPCRAEESPKKTKARKPPR